MAKKRNFLGGMQNYDPKTGEYEPRLTKANGEPATKENMPGGEEGGKSFKSFKKTESELNIEEGLKTWQDEDFGDTYYELTNDVIGKVYDYFGGDEDKTIDYLRKYSWGMDNSDLQGSVEAYALMNKKPKTKQMTYKELGEYLDGEERPTEIDYNKYVDEYMERGYPQHTAKRLSYDRALEEFKKTDKGQRIQKIIKDRVNAGIDSVELDIDYVLEDYLGFGSLEALEKSMEKSPSVEKK